MRKTTLSQRPIDSPMDAMRHFSVENNGEVPIVLVPADRWCCSCMMTVPSGPYCIQHRFGKDMDRDRLADAGLRCTPACNRIAYCVTAQAQTYNAPVKSCPTADNVMVDCDLTLVFILGPAPRDVKEFVYTLGARRFDEFLFAAVEEAIRHLIRTCLHTEVYELRGNSDERVKDTLIELNKKFTKFGVTFQSCAITDVRFKRELQDVLQKTTEFKSKMQEQIKKQKHMLDQIEFQQTRELQELDRANDRVIQDLQAQRARIEIEREQKLTEARGKAEVAITQAKQKAMITKVRAQSEKDVAADRGLKAKEELLADARAKDKSTRIRVEQQCKTVVYEAEMRLQAAENIAQALMREAEAEAKAAESLKIKREHDLALAKIEVLQSLAANSQMVISGENGDRLIGTMLDQSILGDIKVL